LIGQPHSQPPHMLQWDRVTNTPVYSSESAGALDWLTYQPSMGGTDPWLIASASVPEPTAAVLMGIGVGCVIACVLVRKRRAKRRQGAA
jgi:hypothetical protein